MAKELSFDQFIEVIKGGNVEKLKQSNFPKEYLNKTCLYNHRPALCMAIDNKNIPMIKLLLELDADPTLKTLTDGRDFDYFSPLHLAALAGDAEIMKLLLEKATDVTNTYSRRQGETPLHAAVCWGRKVEIVKMLLDKNADINSQDGEGNTPLHLIAKGGVSEMIRLFIRNGANIEAKNFEGQTPLHLAVLNSNENTFVELIMCGADQAAQSNDKKTIYTLANQLPPETWSSEISMYRETVEALVRDTSSLSPFYDAMRTRENETIAAQKIIAEQQAKIESLQRELNQQTEKNTATFSPRFRF